MKLKIRSSDPTILEDEMGNAIFKHVGDYPADVYSFIRYIEGLERQINLLNFELEDERTRHTQRSCC